MSVPFHKQLDPSKQAGQIVNPIPEHFLHQSHKQETTLAQYIERKTDIPKKITFEEWWSSVEDSEFDGTVTRLSGLVIWNVALTKGKL